MYQYILFDLDGTLTDSREGIFKSIRYSLEKQGLPCPPEETLLRFVGPPLQDSFERFCNLDADAAWRSVEIFRERYETVGWAENRAAEGIVEMMHRLQAQGAKMAIASSKPECSVVPIAEKFGFSDYMVACCGSDGKNEAKRDVVLSAMERLGMSEDDKARAIMVGDRKYDVEGAAECGLPCVGVTFFDFAPEGELEASDALAICNTVAELEQFLTENG